jgi:hypothetical protein
MSNINTGGPAFPTQSKLGVNDTNTWITEIPGHPGMTLRDYFAARAMQGMCANPESNPAIGPYVWASAAYEVADAMQKAREA